MRKFLFKTNNYGYVFLLPFFIVLIIFQLYPILYTFYLSFTNLSLANPKGEFIGFSNYIKLFADKFFLQSIVNTWRISIGTLIPQLIFAVGLAAILTRDKIRGKSFFRGIYFLPNLVTAASVGMLFNILLGWKNGLINNILVVLKIIGEDSKIHFLASPVLISSSVSVILWWMWFGHSMILFMAAMVAVPKELYEAAAIDGANAWHSFWKITLPQIKPITLYVMVTSLIGGLNNFDIPYVMGESQSLGDGGPMKAIMTMTMWLFKMGFTGGKQSGYAATISIAIFIMVLIFSLIIFRVMFRRRDAEHIKGV